MNPITETSQTIPEKQVHFNQILMARFANIEPNKIIDPFPEFTEKIRSKLESFSYKHENEILADIAEFEKDLNPDDCEGEEDEGKCEEILNGRSDSKTILAKNLVYSLKSYSTFEHPLEQSYLSEYFNSKDLGESTNSNGKKRKHAFDFSESKRSKLVHKIAYEAYTQRANEIEKWVAFLESKTIQELAATATSFAEGSLLRYLPPEFCFNKFSKSYFARNLDPKTMEIIAQKVYLGDICNDKELIIERLLQDATQEALEDAKDDCRKDWKEYMFENLSATRNEKGEIVNNDDEKDDEFDDD